MMRTLFKELNGAPVFLFMMSEFAFFLKPSNQSHVAPKKLAICKPACAVAFFTINTCPFITELFTISK